MLFEEKYVADYQDAENEPTRLLIDLVPGVIPAPQVGDSVVVHGGTLKIVEVTLPGTQAIGYRVKAERNGPVSG